MHLCNYISLGSGNGLSPVWHQAITWTNADLLSIRPLGRNVSETWIEIQNFSFKKMHLKMLYSIWWPFCPGGDELMHEVLRTRHISSSESSGITIKVHEGWENGSFSFTLDNINQWHAFKVFTPHRDSPASRKMLARRWANVVTYSKWRWANVDVSIGVTLAQRCNTSNYDIVPTFCQRNNLLHFVIFDGWYYVCTLFIPVNMP